MPDDPSIFTDLATRPLAGNEGARELARGELMDRLTHSAPPAGGDTVKMAVLRLGEKPAQVKRAVWAYFLAIALLCLVVGLAFRSGLSEYRRLGVIYNAPLWPLSDHKTYMQRLNERLSANLPEDRRLFFFSNAISGAPETRRWFEECLNHPPEDPAWFEEFYQQASRKAVSPELAAQARRADPGNGLLIMREADPLIRNLESAGKLRTGGSTSSDPSYLKVLELFEEASKSPRYESYIPARQAERLLLMGPAEDIAAISDRLLFLMVCQAPWAGGWSDYEVLPRHAKELSSAGDAEGLRKWIATCDQLTRKALAMQGGSAFFLRASTAKSVRREATKLHLSAEEALLQSWEDHGGIAKARFTPSSSRLGSRVPTMALPRGYWAMMSSPDTVVTVPELEPALRAEHALADRFAALLLAGIFMLLTLLAGLEGWRRPKVTRGLASGLMPLLRPVDYYWLAGLGVLLPLAWHVAWMRLSPMGCRDFSIYLARAIPYLVRIGTFLLLALCLLLTTARWRLAKRGGFVSLAPGALWQGWAVAAYAALLVPLSGMIRYWPDAELHEMQMACAAMGLPVLWLLWQFLAMTLRPGSAALNGVVLWRFLLPVLVTASAVMLAVMPPLKWEERKWVARDTISGPDPGGTQNTVLGARQAKLFREYMLDAMK